jgi:hypothetical protein
LTRRRLVSSIARRIGWYALGIGGIVLIAFVHPDAARELFLGTGDRAGAIVWGLLYGAAGAGIAVNRLRRTPRK